MQNKIPELSIIKNCYNTMYQNIKPKSDKIFTILLPPPNVSGYLHIGHFLNGAIQDSILRYRNIFFNENTYILPGTDHGGLSTEISAIKKLNISPQTDRETKFQLIQNFATDCKNNIYKQLKEFCFLINDNYNKNTLDTDHIKLVQDTFVNLYNRKLICKKKVLVNFDLKLQSPVSDLEVSRKTIKGNLYTILYQLEDSSSLAVATTRPETIFADVALAINPKDNRYNNLIGKYAFVPLINRKIPIIGDNCVDPDFGTGILKITPAHDLTDNSIGHNHNLESISIINPDGTLMLQHLENYNDIKKYDGLSILNARELIAKEIAINIIPVEQTVPYNDKSESFIEYILMDQWVMSMHNIAQYALEHQLEIYPNNWTNLYHHWLSNIKDWCLSRSLTWGHQIPVWYNKSEFKVQIESPGDDWFQKPEVLDTWFSSALWPLSYKQSFNIYPTNVLVTAYDILFFWIARMVMMSLLIDNSMPFNAVYIHGLVRDQNNQKMSKTKGNVLDPLELLSSNGHDQLRLSLFNNIHQMGDIKLSLQDLEKARNMITKLWNFSYYVNMFVKPVEITSFNQISKYFLYRLYELEHNLFNYIEKYNMAQIIPDLLSFLYEVCDWLVEFHKIDKSLDGILYYVYKKILLLFHPIIPMITTYIWNETFNDFILNYEFQFCDYQTLDDEDLLSIIHLKYIINLIRSFKKLNIIVSIQECQYVNIIKHLTKIDDKDIADSKKLDIKGYVLYITDVNHQAINNKINNIEEEMNKIQIFLSKCNENTPINIIQEKKNVYTQLVEEMDCLRKVL